MNTENSKQAKRFLETITINKFGDEIIDENFLNFSNFKGSNFGEAYI